MILHLVSDEKVVHRTIRMFEEYNSGGNIFVCFTSKDTYKHLTKGDNVIKYNSTEINELDFSEISMVIVHYLNNDKIRFIYKHKLQNKDIMWIVWGSDLSNFLYKRRRYNLYSDDNSYPKLRLNYKNNAVYNKLKGINRTMALLFSKFATNVHSLFTDYYRNYFFTHYLNYVQGTDATRKLIENGHKLRCFKGYIDFCYYPIEETLGDLSGKWCSGNNIMIGNSAQATNNHEYILKYLQKIDTSDYSITVPLSYGGDDEYVEIVSKKYSCLPNVKVLLEFMPLSKYNELLLASTVCIYGHFRGEAWGNILISLYLGAKVYLHRNGPSFLKCQRLGFIVFELEEITDTFDVKLTREECEQNRRIALEKYSKDMCGKNIERIKRISQGIE